MINQESILLGLSLSMGAGIALALDRTNSSTGGALDIQQISLIKSSILGATKIATNSKSIQINNETSQVLTSGVTVSEDVIAKQALNAHSVSACSKLPPKGVFHKHSAHKCTKVVSHTHVGGGNKHQHKYDCQNKVIKAVTNKVNRCSIDGKLNNGIESYKELAFMRNPTVSGVSETVSGVSSAAGSSLAVATAVAVTKAIFDDIADGGKKGSDTPVSPSQQ